MAQTAGTWRLESPYIGAQPIADVSTTQNLPLGTRVRARDVSTEALGSAEFIYVKGVASGATNAWAVYNIDDHTTTLAVANSRGPLGVMMATLDASTDYGWLQIFGKAIGKCLTSFADNGVVYLTGTAGSIDDASVAGDYIHGAQGASAATAGDLTAHFELTYPYAGQRVSIAG